MTTATAEIWGEWELMVLLTQDLDEGLPAAAGPLADDLTDWTYVVDSADDIATATLTLSMSSFKHSIDDIMDIIASISSRHHEAYISVRASSTYTRRCHVYSASARAHYDDGHLLTNHTVVAPVLTDMGIPMRSEI